MDRIEIKTESKNYEVIVGENLLVTDNFADAVNKEVFLVVDDGVPKNLIQKVEKILDKKSLKFHSIKMKASEEDKSFSSLQKIHDSLMEIGYSRDCILYAMGGGIICDMTGFAAATFQRGVDFILIPTTLLSQVDASVGGKTAINHKKGKNMIGAFHQPNKVISDMCFLTSLNARQITDGLSEIIKHAAILDYEFFIWLEENINDLLSKNSSVFEFAVSKSIKLKESVVSKDETEKGIRKWLNFGHTFGHAIEMYGNFEEFSHGEAVALGMIMALNMSVNISGLDLNEAERVKALIKVVLAENLLSTKFDPILLHQMMSSDKKKTGDVLNFIVLKAIGEAEIKKNPDLNIILNSIEI